METEIKCFKNFENGEVHICIIYASIYRRLKNNAMFKKAVSHSVRCLCIYIFVRVLKMYVAC